MASTQVGAKSWERFETPEGELWWIAKLNGAYLDESWFFEKNHSSWYASWHSYSWGGEVYHEITWSNGRESFMTTDGIYGTSC